MKVTTSDLRVIQQYQVGATEKKCVHCGSETIQFVEFDKIEKRLDEKKILAAEIWLCGRCGKEFARSGTLYSPEDLTHKRFRVAILVWCGYAVGSLLASAFLL